MKDLMWLADNWDDDEHSMNFREFIQMNKKSLFEEEKTEKNSEEKNAESK